MKPVEVPCTAKRDILPGAEFSDAFEMTVDGQNLDAMEAVKRAVYGAPPWINRLLELRHWLVKSLGLKSGENPEPALRGEDHIGMFPILARQQNHLMLGMNDRHLDFRLLVDIADNGSGRQIITASTIVKTHNTLGRIYLAAVKPFHKIIVPAMMARIAKPLKS
jgi:Protein of unknown function (DUF2867)